MAIISTTSGGGGGIGGRAPRKAFNSPLVLVLVPVVVIAYRRGCRRGFRCEATFRRLLR